MASAAHPLHDRTFRRLFGAQTVSLVGTGVSTVALSLLAHSLAGGDAGAVLGTVLAVKMTVYVLGTPVLARLLGRLPDRPVLIALDLVRVGIVLRLPFVDSVSEIYGLVALLSAAATGFTPRFRALVPRVLPDEARYTRALSLSRMAYDLEALVSPVLAAGALTFMSFDDLFVVDALTFAASAALLAATPLPPSPQPSGPAQSSTHGLRLYLSVPRLRGLLALHLTASAAGAMVIVNTVVLVQHELGLGEASTALCLAASGGGSMLMALLTPRLLERGPDRRLMLAGGAVASLALIAGAALPLSWGTLAVLWALIGLGTSAVHTPAGRLLTRSGQPGDGPALFAADFALSHAAWLVAYPVAGLVGTAFGMGPTFAVLGAVGAAGTAAAAWMWPRTARPSKDGTASSAP